MAPVLARPASPPEPASSPPSSCLPWGCCEPERRAAAHVHAVGGGRPGEHHRNRPWRTRGDLVSPCRPPAPPAASRPLQVVRQTPRAPACRAPAPPPPPPPPDRCRLCAKPLEPLPS